MERKGYTGQSTTRRLVVCSGLALAKSACSSDGAPTGPDVAQARSEALNSTCGLTSALRLPPPIFSRVDVSTAAPGMTRRVYGRLLGGGFLVKLFFPGCVAEFNSVIERYQFSRKPDFLGRAVGVVVFTPAGISGARTFTYRVPYSSW